MAEATGVWISKVYSLSAKVDGLFFGSFPENDRCHYRLVMMSDLDVKEECDLLGSYRGFVLYTFAYVYTMVYRYIYIYTYMNVTSLFPTKCLELFGFLGFPSGESFHMFVAS